MLYFSYGSFLDSRTLKRHAPNAEFVSRAVLPGFEVQFNYQSKTHGGGVTGVEPAPGKQAIGVLYEVSPEEIERLDIVEGVPQGIYYRQTITVINEDGEEHRAETYRTTHPEGPYTPTRRYMDLMIKGAKEHNLNPAYIKELEDHHKTLNE